MDYSNVFYTEEFDSDNANQEANLLLAKGWKLLSAGPKTVGFLENKTPYYNTAYVVGATKEQYQDYLKENTLNSTQL